MKKQKLLSFSRPVDVVAYLSDWTAKLFRNSATVATVFTIFSISLQAATINTNEFAYSMKITFSGYTSGSALANFPVLVELPSIVAATAVSLDGYDLRFTDSDGITLINYEVDKWDPSGTSYIWVQVPSLDATGTDFIWAYWGNQGLTNTAPACTTNGSTWSEGYLGVWHLKETSGSHADSTSNHFNSTLVNVRTQGSAAGIVNGADIFKYTDHRVEFPAFNLNSDRVTITVWGKGHQNSDYTGIFVSRDASTVAGLVTYGGKLRYMWNNNRWQWDSGLSIPVDQWAFMAMVLDPAKAVLYVNEASATDTSHHNPEEFDGITNLGCDRYNAARHWVGLLDEVRISSVTRSAEWLSASYQTIASNSAFTTYGEISGLGAAVYWDTSTNALLQAGSGVWDARTTTSWSDSTAGSNPLKIWPALSVAHFTPSGVSTVTVSGTVIAKGMQIDGSGYTFTDGYIDLGEDGIAANADATLGSVITGSAGLLKTGAGTLTLNAENTYSGPTVISNGTLSMTSPATSLNVTNNCLLWLKADAGVITDASGKVTEWQDQSGSGNNASGGRGTLTLVPNALHAKPVVRFSNDGNSWLGLPELTTIRTVFWVLRERVVGKHPLLGDDDKYFFRRGDNGYIWSFYGPYGSVYNGKTRLMGRDVDGTKTPLGTGWRMVSLVTTNNAAASRITADRYFWGHSWDGEIAEIIIYDQPLSDSQVQDVETYLSKKWIKNELPQNAELKIAQTGRLELNGNTATTGALSDSGSTGGVITNSGTLAAALTITGITNTTFSGTISDGVRPVSFNKSGTGTLTLTGNLNYSGSTCIKDGGLVFKSDVSPASVSVNNATLALDNNATLQTAQIEAGGSSTFSWISGTLRSPASATNFNVGPFSTITLGSGPCICDIPAGQTNLITASTITGSGGLTKTGAGSLTLSGEVTFAGDITVSNGTLKVLNLNTAAALITIRNGQMVAIGSASNASITVDGASSIGVNSTANAGTLTARNLTLVSGAALHCTVDETPDFIISGTLTTAGSNRIDLLVAEPLPVGVYPLIDYTNAIGGTGFSAFNATLPTAPRTYSYLTNNLADTRIDLVVAPSHGNTNLIWTGAANNQWNRNNTANWRDAHNASVFINGDSVLFDDSTSNTAINIVQDSSPASIEINAASNNYTFSGATLHGSAALIKRGNATLTLINNNTFSGGTLIEGGVLQLGNGGSAGMTGTGSITNNANLTINHSNPLTFPSLISGTGSLVQVGSGTLIFEHDNTYSGGTTLDGPLQIGINGTSGSLGSGPIVINGKQLTINRSDNIAIDNALSGNGTVYKLNNNTVTYGGTSTFSGNLLMHSGGWTLASGATMTNLDSAASDYFQSATWNIDGTLDTATFKGVASGAGTQYATYQGKLNVNGLFSASTYYGAAKRCNTASSYQTLNINHNGTAVIGTMYLAGNGYDAYGTVQDIINISGTLNAASILGWVIDNNGSAVTVNRYINVNYGGRLNVQSIDLHETDPDNQTTCLLKLARGTIANLPAGDLTIDSTTPIQLDRKGYIKISSNQTATINGVIRGSGNLMLTGAGTVSITASNTFSGDLIISDGTLHLSTSFAIPDNDRLTISSSAKVQLDAGVNETIKELYINDTRQTKGTWGSRSSTASYKNDRYFSGSGILTVSEGPSETGILMIIR